MLDLVQMKILIQLELAITKNPAYGLVASWASTANNELIKALYKSDSFQSHVLWP